MWWRIWNGGTSTGEVTIHGEQKIFSFTSNPATCFGSRFHQQFVMSPDSTLTRLIERTVSFPTRYWFFEAVTCSTRLDKKGRCAGWLRWLGPPAASTKCPSVTYPARFEFSLLEQSSLPWILDALRAIPTRFEHFLACQVRFSLRFLSHLIFPAPNY
jgi:hypothetical protein